MLITPPTLLEDLGMAYPNSNSKVLKRYGLYNCACGNTFRSQTADIKSKATISCGCTRIKHGMNNHPIYRAWSSILQRCNNPKSKGYKEYGARGIVVCKSWLIFENFKNDMLPSWVKGLSIDRKNNDEGYSRDNCRWTTKSIQSRNTRVLKSTNTSGYRGVNWSKARNKWISRIHAYGVRVHLGYFNTAIEAAIAYDKYVTQHGLEHSVNKA